MIRKIQLENWGSILGTSSSKITFLAGAGISMEPPSQLPSALEFSRVLLEFIAVPGEVEKLLAAEGMRYEMVVERVQSLIDPNLFFLDYLEEKTQFNRIHNFLAQCGLNGAHIITTNFDYLIESAMLANLPIINLSKTQIIPIITKQDFETYRNVSHLSNKTPIYKIHGSKKNIITGENTQESLITTISSLGKNRAEGETFAVEVFKKPLINSILEDSILIVMGYSGNDDFDITPLLSEFSNLKQLIWIEHQTVSVPIIEQFFKDKAYNPEEIATLPKTDQFLFNLAMIHDYNVIHIKGNTGDCIENIIAPVVFNLFQPDQKRIQNFSHKLPEQTFSHKLPNQSFRDFIKEDYGQVTPLLRYNTTAKTYSLLGMFDDLLRISQQGEILAEKEQDLINQAIFLSHISIVELYRGNLDRSLDINLKALKLDEQSGNKGGMANRYNSIGFIYRRKSQFQQALAYYQKSLTISTEIGDQMEICLTTNNIGVVYYELGDYKNALAYYQRSLKVAGEIGDLNKKATRLLNIGVLYMEQFDNPDAAEKNYVEALKIYEETGNKVSLGSVYNNLGMIFWEKKNLDKAIEFFLKSQESAKLTGNLSVLSSTSGNLFDIYLEKGLKDQAIAFMTYGIEIDHKFHDLTNVVNKSYRLGKYYQKYSDWTNAIAWYESALEFYGKIELEDDFNEIYYELGEIHFELDEFHEAIAQYRKGIPIAEKLGKYTDLSAFYGNIGHCYNNLEDYPKAIESFSEGLQWAIKTKDQDDIRVAYKNLGCAHLDAENPKTAAEFLQKSLIIAKSQQNIEKQLDLLNLLFDAYYQEKEFEKVIQNCQQRIELAKQIQDQESLYLAYGNLGVIYSQQNQFALALNCFESALAIVTTLGLEENITLYNENIAFVQSKLNP